jgi:hypothetical protein
VNQPPGYGPGPYGQQPQQPYPQQGYGPQPGYGQQPPPQQPKKKGMSGCLIAVLVVVGLLVVGGSVTAILVYKYFGKPIAAMAEVVKEGQTAPGTNELREAGCKQASAMDAEKLFHVAKQFAEQFGGNTKDMKDPDAPTIVLCTLKSSKSLTCDEVAKTFSVAADPWGNFSVLVQKKNSQECSALYDSSGKKIGASTSSLPTIQTGDDTSQD